MRIEKLLKEVSAIETNPFTITPLKAAILFAAAALYFISFITKPVSPPYIAGLFAQAEVLISVYITVKVQRIGYYVSLCFNLLSFFAALNAVFLSNIHETIPGIAVPLSTIIITSLIAYKAKLMNRAHFRLMKQHKELVTAKSEAEKANRVKSDFLSSMSHEIRTPLNNILGYIELISLGDLDETQKEYLTIIETSSKNLVRIINDILDFSKIEHKKFRIISEPFDPVETINHTIRLFELTTLRKNILLDFKHNHVPHCIGDSLRLHQVILNLVANSVKFTPTGGYIKVELTAETENSSATLNISVSDTGMGIPLEKQKNIFDPFEQVDPSVPLNFGGTGLGLAVSWNIVNLMGGNLSVDSELGKGSRFFFSLKLPVAPKEEFMAETQIRSFSETISPIHALIAEDTTESRELLIKMLSILGITCDAASNGKEAYELFKKKHYDTVILDGYMPEMDGMTAAQKIRDHEKENSKKRTPIIALSARALSSERDEFIKAGADHFIVKPVSFETLSDGLSRFVRHDLNSKIMKPDNGAFFAKLSAFLGIPETSVTSVFDGFKNSTLPQYINEIKNALNPLERDKLMRAAHKLKGASSSLLLENLASISSLLEESSKSGNPEEIRTHAEKLFIESENVSKQSFTN
ncbi:MAG TPA: ATP-binding protein [Spirochaetota bacterium]|nr:ATP-binding protein [Spirochaetota bacterium]HOR44811.1 ATP-binding protein [Spirochaetota bacterium]HPK56176.1 ATP-binding protein [Spirochaetota bacterium]